MSTPQFLLLANKPLDIEAIQTVLTTGGIDCELSRVDTRAAFVTALETAEYDLILAAYAMPDFDGMAALEIARNLCPETPFIFVSASLGEELAIEALKQGAADYVLTQRLERLVPCVQRALQEAQEQREYKRAEAALRQNEARLRAVAANLPNAAAFLVDRNLRYLIAEGKALEEAGVSTENLVGKTLWEALDPALANYCEPYYHRALEGEPFQSEHHSYGRDYISHGTPLYNAQGEVDSVLVVSYDISDRKQAEAAQRESEERYRTLFESIDEGFCVVEVLFDPAGTPCDHRILRANPAFERQTGITNPEGKTASELAPGIEQYWNDLYAQVIHTGESVRTEHRSDALDRWFNVLVSRVGDGTMHQVAIVFSDITDRKQAERQAEFLTHLSQRLGTVTDAAEINRIVTREVGTFFNGHRCYYLDVTPDGNHATVLPDWRLDGPDLAGTYNLALFGVKQWWETAARQPFGIDDVNVHSWTKDFADNYTQINLQSYAIAPFVREGRWLASIGVSSDQPRHWTTDEMVLLENIVARVAPLIERARVETALRASRDTFRYLVENSPFGVYTVDADFRLAQVSAGAQKVFENVRPLIGRDFAEVLRLLWPEPFASEVIALFRHTLETGELYHSPSTTERRHDIEEVESYDWKLERLALPDGRFGVVCHFYDLSERQRYEAALRESEERFRNMADNAPVMVWVTDPTGYCTYLSQSWYDFTGQTEETGLGFGWLSRVHSDDQEMSERIFLNANQRQEAFSLEYRLQNKQGEYIWVIDAASPWFGVDGQFKGFIGSVLDITDRKLTEATLRESEELKQSILDSSKDCIKVLTLTSEIVYVNTGGLRLLEIDDPTDVLNAVWVDFWQGEDHENAKIAIAAATAGGTGQFQGYRSTHKGTPKWWDSIVTPVRNSAGAITQLVAVSRDITKQKQAETEREHLLAQEQTAREAAEITNRIKDEFLAVLSHELRSPLNPILGWSKLLQQGKLDAARTKTALETIDRNAQLQVQLIDDLLDISRILRGKLSLNVQPADLSTVISAALETVHLAAEAKAIRIQTVIAPNVGAVMGDAGRLQQVVWNLLSNAVKFTPPSGQVTVALAQSGTHAQIQVIDTGKGIKPDFLPYVFEHFRQEDGATTRKFGGLGLGLAIARQIVEMHGGQIYVESPGEEQGATFTVQLPLAPHLSELPSSKASLPAVSDLNGIRILVVDDEADSREIVTFVLEQAGAIITNVSSGIEALQAFEQSLPDLIVSDIGMPEMDGYMLLQQIRSLDSRRDLIEQGKRIPAIALTAYAGEYDRQQAITAGFQQHIPKPVDPETLVSAIRTLCSGSSNSGTR